MANPASVYCEDNGGTLEIRTGADGGEYGVCIFDDGSECEEWAYFRGECVPGQGSEIPAPVPTEEESAPEPSSEGDTGAAEAAGEPSGGGATDDASLMAAGLLPAYPASGEYDVVGWFGKVVSLPDGAEYDDKFVLWPDGTGEVGIDAVHEEDQHTLDYLRDTERYVHVWGVMTCGVPDVNGCQIRVERLRPDGPGEFFEPDPVEGWTGVLDRVGGEPHSGGDQYIQLDSTPLPIRYGIHAYDDDALAAQLESLIGSGTPVRVWGSLMCGIPDIGGCQIAVTRIETD